REMVAWDATVRADFASARLDEFGADPIFGAQASLPVRMPKLTIPAAAIAEGSPGKLHGIASYFRDLAGRHREGVAVGRTPAEFAVRQTVEQLDRWLGTPVAEDPLLPTGAPPRGAAPPAPPRRSSGSARRSSSWTAGWERQWPRIRCSTRPTHTASRTSP